MFTIWGRKKLSKAEKRVLQAMIEGATLKSHRYLDGNKSYQLHPLQSSPEPVNPKTVKRLYQRGYIGSNQKFPAASYILTEKGKSLAQTLTDSKANPLSGELR